MPELILHHFDLSPFAEKIRVALGIKGLPWRSVQIPMIMPKPDLTALTGGYRKTPVLQIGADIYCDTRLIARELERRHPTPSLFPNGCEPLTMALGAWSDTTFFEPGAGLSMGTNTEIPEPLLNDRKAFFNFMDFDTLETSVPHLYGQLRTQLALLDRHLTTSGDYLLGDTVSWADVLAYFVVWMVRGNLANADELLRPCAAVCEWEPRLQAFGHGNPDELSAGDAIDVARASTPATPVAVDEDDALGLSAGDRVSVAPEDYGKDPVIGQLVRLTLDDIALRRRDERADEIIVNFPRAGYRVEREN